MRRSLPADGRGRPRDERLTATILEAVLARLASHGARGMRTEDIAAIAGTSKQALYRRWPDKAAMIAAAVRHSLQQGNPAPPNSGDLVRDLTIVLGNTIRQLAETPLAGAVAALVGERDDAELAAALSAVLEERRGLMEAVFASAVARGDLPPDRDIALDIDALLGTIYFRLLIRRLPVAVGDAPAIVAAWLGSAARH
jgi:AcrR family transcriptional regulator